MKLKPCPFCGVEPTLFQPDHEHEQWKVACFNGECRAVAYIENQNKVTVVKLWNTRPGEGEKK